MLSRLVVICSTALGCATAAAGPSVIDLERNPAGTYYLDGAIDGFGEISLLLDTGSSYLVISEAMRQQLAHAGRLQSGRELHGTMADGSRQVISTYRVSALRVGEHCWIRDVEAAVFPGNARPILGMNVLSVLAPFTFSTEPPQLDLDGDLCEATPTAAPIAAAGAADAVLAR